MPLFDFLFDLYNFYEIKIDLSHRIELKIMLGFISNRKLPDKRES